MAVASSSARRKAATNSGTSTGTRLRTRETTEPVEKLAPRACCARMMRSASSARVGMKRRAIVIMSASSWAGTPMGLSGRSIISSPSVSRIGDVVSVRIDAMVTSRISRVEVTPTSRSPSRVATRGPERKSSLPASGTG